MTLLLIWMYDGVKLLLFSEEEEVIFNRYCIADRSSKKFSFFVVFVVVVVVVVVVVGYLANFETDSNNAKLYFQNMCSTVHKYDYEKESFGLRRLFFT
jgi:hypothetical protein